MWLDDDIICGCKSNWPHIGHCLAHFQTYEYHFFVSIIVLSLFTQFKKEVASWTYIIFNSQTEVGDTCAKQMGIDVSKFE